MNLSFSSHTATWNHPAHLLILEGDVSLIDPAQLSLHAEHIELLHCNRDISHISATGLTTLHLKTTGLFTSPSLRCTGTLDLDPLIGLITANGPLRFSDEGITVSGQSGQLSYRNQLLEVLHLDGNVRLVSTRIQNRPSYALAEQMTLYPEQNTLILTATPPHRVLFWQEKDQMCLTATELHIRRDPVTHQDAIQGYGDVHFSFEPHEQDAITQLFSQHIL